MAIETRFQVMSDLHLEHHKDGGYGFMSKATVAADTVVIAGDLTNEQMLLDTFLHICSLWKNVVYVFGNHELYGSSFRQVRKELENAKEECPNLHALDNDVVEIEGQRFVGTTMWFRDTPEARVRKKLLNDFSYIRDFEKLVYDENEEAIKFLWDNVFPGDVVVTHHLPTSQGTPPKYKAHPIEPYFVCDMEDLIVKRSPAVWVFGHMHDCVEINICDTHLVCNPFGYPAQETEFDPEKVISK